MEMEKLKQMILDNSDAQILVVTDEDSWTDECSCEFHKISSASIEYLTEYSSQLIDRENVLERIINDCMDNEDYIDLSDKEYLTECTKIVNRMDFKKYIILRME